MAEVVIKEVYLPPFYFIEINTERRCLTCHKLPNIIYLKSM